MKRIRDWLRERRIRRLADRLRVETDQGASQARRRATWQAMADEVMARSPNQVARMERRMGMR